MAKVCRALGTWGPGLSKRTNSIRDQASIGGVSDGACMS